MEGDAVSVEEHQLRDTAEVDVSRYEAGPRSDDPAKEKPLACQPAAQL